MRNMLQCVLVCCSVLDMHVCAHACKHLSFSHTLECLDQSSVLQCVVVCCSVLQCVAVGGSV